MTGIDHNSGVVTTGGHTSIVGSAIGNGAEVHHHPAPGRRRDGAAPDPPRSRCDIGIVTILAEEARAVVDVLGLAPLVTPGEQPFYGGRVPAGDGDGAVRVVMTRALGPGQLAVMPSLASLRRIHDPGVLALVGIGGGIHPDVQLDDVVVATRVVYYDLRKVVPGGVVHRGSSHDSRSLTAHAVNAFFTEHGDPAELRPIGAPRRGDHSFRVRHGPMGSGEAVIADADSEIRRYLAAFNDKILAVDMEAGGLGQFCHEASAGDHPLGWVVVRGISDLADGQKDDTRHLSAARNAAQAFAHLAPYLRETGVGRRADLP